MSDFYAKDGDVFFVAHVYFLSEDNDSGHRNTMSGHHPDFPKPSEILAFKVIDDGTGKAKIDTSYNEPIGAQHSVGDGKKFVFDTGVSTSEPAYVQVFVHKVNGKPYTDQNGAAQKRYMSIGSYEDPYYARRETVVNDLKNQIAFLQQQLDQLSPK